MFVAAITRKTMNLEWREAREMILERVSELRVSIFEQMEFIVAQIDDIRHHEKISIHDMADLERYGRTLQYLSDCYSNIEE